ncbi:MAG: MBL fold metallo-hydrolase [Gemmatimonadales bacterium]|nr:MBL fold metallo-hydrolase [Gemmatimonadales bacterium]NIO31562.1 MBL fold metallo-hydrolase [Gemmatimonadota bacterium]
MTVRQLSVPGFFIAADDKAVLVDALTRHRWGPATETRELLATAAPPFDEIDLVLVTHSHGDHFHRESVARHLVHNPNAVLVTGMFVRDELAGLPEFQEFEDRVIALDPEPGEVVEVEANGIRMKVFRLSHGERGNDYSMDNLAMMADLLAAKIFTTGDVAPSGQTEIFQRARLDRDSIDFAFLAFTMFENENQPEGMSIIDEYIKPRHIVVAHLGDRHFGEFSEAIRNRYANAIIF